MRASSRLRLSLNPIIVRELRTRMRGGRPYLVLTTFLVLLSAAGFGIYALMLQQARMGMTLLSPQVGQVLFRGLSFCELLLIVFLAPSLTSGAISSEREHLTYDMLIATPLRSGEILWGKLIAALSYLFLLIFAAVPIFSVVLVFGGVDLGALWKILALLLASTVMFGTVGLFCSTLLRRTARATTVSYLLVLLLIGVPSLISSVWGQFSTPPGQPTPPAFVYSNPFSALISVTTPQAQADMSQPFFGVTDPFMGLPFLAMLGPSAIYYGPNGPVVVPIYRGTLLCYGLLTLLLCWAGSHLALPSRRWRPRWSDLTFAVLVLALLSLAYISRSWWYILPPEQFMGKG